MPDISPRDRDLLIRTVLGEAADQPADGQSAVAHVVLNRLNAGKFGRDVSSVILAPNAFEPWSTRASELNAISQNSAPYQRAAAIVDDVVAGRSEDPTFGATHFLQPDVVRARRGGSLPNWAQGGGVKIGDHMFYAPDNPEYGKPGTAASAIASALGTGDQAKNAKDAISLALGATEPALPAAATSFADDRTAAPQAPAKSIFSEAGFDVPQATQTAPSAPAAAPEAPQKQGGLFESAGFTLPGTKQAERPAVAIPDWAKARGAVDYVQIPGGAPQYIDAAGKVIPPPDVNTASGETGTIADLPGRVGEFATNLVPNAVQSTVDTAKAGQSAMASGLADIRGNRPAAGVGKVVMGGLGWLGAPVSGGLDALVTQPATRITGNPEFGEKLALVAPSVVGGVPAARAVMPSNRAINVLANAVGAENLPAAIERLRANPRLSLMDVSDPVRTMAQGLIDPANPKAQNILVNRVKERQATAPAATNAAYTAAMGPAPDVVKMVEGLKDRARQAGREAIQPAIQNAKPVDVSPVLDAIDKEVKPGIQAMLDQASKLPLSSYQEELLRLKQRLQAPSGETLTDAGRLHEIQSDLGDMAFMLQRSSDAKDRLLGGKLRTMNEQLIDQIDAASGGTYRPARQKFKDAKDVSEAFESGFDTLKNRQGLSGLEDRPEAFKQWMDNATPEEVVARRLGTRADIDQKIRGVKNQALAGQQITKIEYNRDKLEMLFGKDETDRLVRAMQDAQDEARTNAKLLEGAKTAETLAGRQALKVRDVGGGNPIKYAIPAALEFLGSGQGVPGVGAATGLALGALHRGAQKIGQLGDLARNTEVARMASAVGPERDALIHALVTRAPGSRVGIGQKATNTLLSLGMPLLPP